MMTGRIRTTIVLGALIVSACGSTTSATPSVADVPAVSMATSGPMSSDGVVAAPPTGPAPTAAPTPTSGQAASTPPPATATRWTKPRRIGGRDDCSGITAGIDVASRYHVAASCGGQIRYYVTDDGRDWDATVFAHPTRRADVNPQIAFWGAVVYVAYTRIAFEEGGCGDDGIRDVGAFVRSRIQPGGAWSAPLPIGRPDDRLASFRVDGQTLYATLWNARSGRMFYETVRGSSIHRYRMPDAGDLRIGSDGRARIVYQAGDGIRFATFGGSAFSPARIAGTNRRDLAGALILGADDTAHVVWTRLPVPPWGGGCAADEPTPQDQGTFYAANASGSWKVERITKEIGETSLQVDEKTGRVHVLVNGTVLRYYTSQGDQTWVESTVTSVDVSSPLLRLDPATGTLLVVFLGGPDSTRIYTMTKP